MTESDEKEFLDFVKSTGDVVFVESLSRTKDFQPMAILPLRKDEHGFPFFMFNRSVSKEFPARKLLNRVDDKYEFMADNTSGPLVAFQRCLWEPNCVFDGGLQAISSYLADDNRTMVRKEPEFLEWCETMSKWIRRNHTKLTGTKPLHWVGSEAGRLFDEGRIDLMLQRNNFQELFIDGNLAENSESWRKRKGV
jgi:hypothetical protein